VSAIKNVNPTIKASWIDIILVVAGLASTRFLPRGEIIVCDPGSSRMAWFLNHYTCYRCGRDWSDDWSCMCDDDCPHCGARHSTPVDSDDLTVLVEPDGSEFVVLRSPDTAEHDPDYREVGRFPTREQALEFLAADG
jgi:hypothetical protein